MLLKVPRKNVQSLLALSALGLLEAIKSGAVPESAGIWTIGMPSFWEPVARSGAVSPELRKVLEQFDELAALRKLNKDKAETLIDELSEDLRAILSNEDLFWNIEWSPDETVNTST